ncbi:MAG: IS200/IS605 family transposase [Ferruginibacter sp.]
MSHSLTKIWVHAVWSTKNRYPLIDFKIEQRLYDLLYTEFIAMDSPAKIINGMPDHIHCLFRLNPQKALADVIKQIKGSSSYFVNHNDLTFEKFSWQTGYYAFSVSESVIPRVTAYIQNQKQHHSKISFDHESETIIKLFEKPTV